MECTRTTEYDYNYQYIIFLKCITIDHITLGSSWFCDRVWIINVCILFIWIDRVQTRMICTTHNLTNLLPYNNVIVNRIVYWLNKKYIYRIQYYIVFQNGIIHVKKLLIIFVVTYSEYIVHTTMKRHIRLLIVKSKNIQP